MKVFISWAGETSGAVARTLKDWFPTVIQQVKPFLSSQDIQTGRRWFDEIGKQLDDTNFGILVITREALDSDWLHFEAGALSKRISEARVVPLLLDGLTPSNLLGSPLSGFQMVVSPTQDEIWKLLQDMNELLGESKLTATVLEKTFKRAWSDLESGIRTVLEASAKTASKPKKKEQDQQELLEHLVALCLGISHQVSELRRPSTVHFFGNNPVVVDPSQVNPGAVLTASDAAALWNVIAAPGSTSAATAGPITSYGLPQAAGAASQRLVRQGPPKQNDAAKKNPGPE